MAAQNSWISDKIIVRLKSNGERTYRSAIVVGRTHALVVGSANMASAMID